MLDYVHVDAPGVDPVELLVHQQDHAETFAGKRIWGKTKPEDVVITGHPDAPIANPGQKPSEQCRTSFEKIRC